MFRSLIVKVFPKLASRFEEESRQWMIQCQKCGHETDVWDAGGIRYEARGTVHRLGKCSRCGRTSMLRIYRPDDTHSPDEN